MREAIFIQFPKGDETPKATWCSVVEAKAAWKSAVANPPEGIEYVEVWTSHEGVVKRKNLLSSGRISDAGKKFSQGSEQLGKTAKSESGNDGKETVTTPKRAETVATAKPVDPNDAGAVPLTAEEQAEVNESAAPATAVESTAPIVEAAPLPGPAAEEVVESPAAPATVDKPAKAKNARGTGRRGKQETK